ncbi:unnamed protein product [Moneuplotes crassus]|uniref:Rhodanese domain-containing protein n=1 Tax=Euplotes crassus TaxID=5936 RepID=A0AAD1XPQ6_EUPCR|nr:unnamed protein product [Moneuplotes crassus]
MFITAEKLAKRIFEKDRKTIKKNVFTNLKVIDVSAGGEPAAEAFYKKAIPNALFLNVFKTLKDNQAKYPNGFPSAEVVKESLEALGINKTDELVLYFHPGKHSGATRAYVILNHYGLNVKILEGGLRSYEGLGLPTQQGTDYSGERSIIGSLKSSKDLVVTLEEMHNFEEGKVDTFQVIDCRAAKSFNGEATDNIEGCRQGNIEGSINIEASEFMNQDGTFKSEEEICDLAAKHKLDPKKEIVCMCRTGIAATVGIVGFMKASSIGFPKIKLYDGSWSEYGSNY